MRITWRGAAALGARATPGAPGAFGFPAPGFARSPAPTPGFCGAGAAASFLALSPLSVFPPAAHPPTASVAATTAAPARYIRRRPAVRTAACIPVPRT
ncbi:hypothetical protein GCM10018773_12670 [Streptomyces candidus]|nr:hypothetical protein GCM10018773_12670 [Streptomyces candidus]